VVRNKIKIILQKGGFAGDLITALYDYSALVELEFNGKIKLDPNRTLLQNNENNFSLEHKDSLLRKHKILSVCDTEFSFIHRKKTIFLYSSEDSMTEFFCKRFQKYHPTYFVNISITNYIIEHNRWRDFWLKKFQNNLDMSKIFNNDFLEKIPFLTLNKEKIVLFEKWKNLNRFF
jgi:hypothetical protein